MKKILYLVITLILLNYGQIVAQENDSILIVSPENLVQQQVNG